LEELRNLTKAIKSNTFNQKESKEMWIKELSKIELTSQLTRNEIKRIEKEVALNRNTTMNMSQYLTKEINSINRQLYELEMKGRDLFLF
jgi:hypothetical protein